MSQSVATRWAEVPGFPGYRVSDTGVVVGPAGKPLRPTKCSPPRGARFTYLKVGIYRQRKRHWFFVQRLVLLAFVGPPPDDKPDAGHRNHDAHDNRLANLEWKNHAANVAESYGDEATTKRDERRAIEAEGCGVVFPNVWLPGVPF